MCAVSVVLLWGVAPSKTCNAFYPIFNFLSFSFSVPFDCFYFYFSVVLSQQTFLKKQRQSCGQDMKAECISDTTSIQRRQAERGKQTKKFEAKGKGKPTKPKQGHKQTRDLDIHCAVFPASYGNTAECGHTCTCRCGCVRLFYTCKRIEAGGHSVL